MGSVKRVALAGVLAAAVTISAGTVSGAAEPSQKRIVGGGVANPADWPFAAALETRSGFQFCSASVVAPDAILTAAHCIFETDLRKIRVITGRPNLRDESAGQELKVVAGYVPNSFVRRGRRDVGILRLESPTSAPSVTLASTEEDAIATAPRMPVATAGWGARRPNGIGSSAKLRAVEVKATNGRRCERKFKRYRGEEEICTVGAKRRNGRESACYGDSGGPLVADTPGGTRIVGTTSYGALRCGKGKPTVFARVAANLGFINRSLAASPRSARRASDP